MTTRTGGAKKVQDKGRGALTRPPASRTAPQSRSAISLRWSEFSLFAVTGGRYQKIQRGNRSVPPSHKVAVMGGFLAFHRNQCGGHFSLPGVKPGAVSPLLLQPPRYCRFQAGIYAEFDAQKTKKKFHHKMHQRLQRGPQRFLNIF